jgi:APA family basic amino acid/polyamine antiporter
MPSSREPAQAGAGLRRELTVMSAAALVVSNMIGTGIFTTTGFLAGDLGRPSLVLGVWLAGGVVALAGCLAYAELGINFPRSGGEYVYLRQAWGSPWGFVSGWVSFFAGFSAPIAAGALAFSEYLGRLVPSLSLQTSGKATAVPAWLHLGDGQLLALVVIAIFATVNILGLPLAAKLQNTLTALKLGILTLFLGLAFAMGKGHWSNFALTAHRISPHSLGAQFAVSLIFVMYAYSGWNAATYVAEEMKAPERTLPRALLAGTSVVVLVYLALNVAFIYALPVASLQGVIRVAAAAASALFGARAGSLFSGVMAVAILSCVSAMVVVGPRVYYAMAQDGCFFPGAARVDPRRQTPVQAILYQAIASGLMVLTGTFEALIIYIGFTLVLFAALATAGLFRMRHRPGWKRLPAVSWGYPLVPSVFILASLWMLAYTLVLRPSASLLGLLTVASGAAVYNWKFRP